VWSRLSLFAVIASLALSGLELIAQSSNSVGRERLLMDFGWRFAFGHATDPARDFDYAGSYFSYFAKTGNGAGPAGLEFDDSAWRRLDLPHDWVVELPFDGRGSHSHGYKAVGRHFPENSVGWYRKAFLVPAADLGRRISVEFDGAFRDARVWINGHYLGREESGYHGFGWNLSEFLNYGGENVLSVRLDASVEEGWFYEGAGLYRHVWLVKTDPLHVQRDGTFVTTEITNQAAAVTARVIVVNESTNTASFDLEQTILGPGSETAGESQTKRLTLKPGDAGEFSGVIAVANPKLWSIETPHLHRLVTRIRSNGKVVDAYETTFGIRSIRFDPDRGFLLNGERVQLKGSNNHQDHAGVGSAIPDALQEFRIARLKEMGGNAYRASHNPPTPELLDACDRLGMVVIDENRLMGASDYHREYLRRLIVRDRNHPSVILWSLGNEEWGIEGNEKGERITTTMQTWANLFDPTRPCTIGSSGGWGWGSSRPIAVMGYNYISHGSTDAQHKKFPWQAGVGTEETTTQQTRGIYFDNRDRARLAPLEKGDSGGNCEKGWKHYAERPYLAGLFYWTGFDYRGESTPFGYPAVSSQFGILDTCGFPKDSFYYLKSWWVNEPMVHVFPHWNWPGKEGQEITVNVNSNCEEVELFLNQRSLGRKTMERNSHLEWKVNYEPGTVVARGFSSGRETASDKVETTGASAAIELAPHRPVIRADAEDVAVVTIKANDAQGRFVPTASNEITFEISGPGRIIGVGNGDPASHEPDRFVDKFSSLPITNWRRKSVDGMAERPEVALDVDDSGSGWQPAFGERGGTGAQTNVYRGVFELAETRDDVRLSLILRSFGDEQSLYLNGRPLGQRVRRDKAAHEFDVDRAALRSGRNVIGIVATPATGRSGNQNSRPAGGPVSVRVVTPPEPWKRSLFNGLAQVIVQSSGQPGEIVLTAKAPGLTPTVLKLPAQPAALRPAVPAK
jgi:beta-galactosidase